MNLRSTSNGLNNISQILFKSAQIHIITKKDDIKKFTLNSNLTYNTQKKLHYRGHCKIRNKQM
jgi:hypothetical protein